MQGQRNLFQSLPGPLHFDCGSNSNSSDMDQPIYQSNLLLSPNDMNMDYTANQENRDENKIVHGWNTAPRMEDGPCERTEIISSNHVGLNLNNTPVDEAQPFPHSLNLTCVSQNVEQNVQSGPHANNADASLRAFMPNFFETPHVPYSNSNASSSDGIGRVSEDDGRARNSLYNRLLACKRKNREGVVGESSTSSNISADLSLPNPSRYPPAASSLEVRSPSFSLINGDVLPEWYPNSSSLRNPETSQRNLRARINLPLQHDVSSSQPHLVVGSNMLSTDLSPGEPSSFLNQPHTLPVSVLPHHVHHSPSSSSIPPFLQRRMRLIASHEETSNRSLPINGVTHHPNWNLSNSNLSMSGNRDCGSSGVIPLPGSMREPCEMVPLQYPRNLAEIARSSLFPVIGSESGHQSSTVPSRRSSHSSSTQERGHSSRAVRRVHSQPYPRTTASIDRQHGLSSTPLSARSRDRRSRMISEIRSALDLMRRGVNLHFEDVFLLDRSRLYGHHSLNDRHRDMRLDVDNMSYEELLALEERIGYVSTGLCDQAILKCLKNSKYSTCKLEVASGEEEPCSICQEDYNEGEDIGTLECRHDFHAACIKQWLMIKNLCPICKTTALGEGRSTIRDDGRE